MQCHVCCDKRGGGGCARCGFDVCRPCARRCATEYGAQCPSCHRTWDTAEQRRRLGVAFCHAAQGPYRTARRARLVRRELGRLEHSVSAAERERERRRLVEERNLLDDEIRSGRSSVAALWPRYRAIQRAIGALGERGHAEETHTARCAHGRCPGFLDARGMCMACEKRTCVHCHEAIDGDHVCDPDSIASRSAIARECRPCAQCGVPSARAEGCPVMWCVKCHAFWNWDTGRVIEGRMPHNPDHRAWLASGSGRLREVDDVPCGGLPDALATNAALMRTFVQTLDVHPGAHTVVAAYNGLQRAQTLRHTYARAWDEARETEPMRIAYLLGDVDEEQFGHALERHDRLLHFRRDVGIVLETLVFAGADIFQRFCAREAECEQAALELWTLHDHVLAALRDVGKVHARTVPLLEQWHWILPYARRPT